MNIRDNSFKCEEQRNTGLMLDIVSTIRIAAVVVVSLVYMIFDVFNNRNVPNVLAYGILAFSFIMTFLYYPTPTTLIESAAAGALILAAGYVLYRIGHVGAADITEMASISMLLFIQPAPYFANVVQYNLPFIVSVFIATGVFALLMIPLYYLPRAIMKPGSKLMQQITRGVMLKGALTLVAYALFIIFFYSVFPTANIIGILILVFVALSSFITILFEKGITGSMVKYIGVNSFEEGDIVATNLMSDEQIRIAKSRVHSFDRLLTKQLINEMKKNNISDTFPVYRNAMPLALPIFLGTVASLLIGNFILLII